MPARGGKIGRRNLKIPNVVLTMAKEDAIWDEVDILFNEVSKLERE